MKTPMTELTLSFHELILFFKTAKLIQFVNQLLK